MNQQITDSARNENTLDLKFPSNELLIGDITIARTIYSDHSIIEVQITRNLGLGMFSKFNFKNHRTKWDKLTKNISWETVMSTLNPHSAWRS